MTKEVCSYYRLAGPRRARDPEARRAAISVISLACDDFQVVGPLACSLNLILIFEVEGCVQIEGSALTVMTSDKYSLF